MPEYLDLTPKFQKFYRLAESADLETRWALWQEHYAFAAVPPIEAGQAMARRLLDDAWEKYAQLPTDLSAKVAWIEQQVKETLTRLEQLFGTSAPSFKLVAYVGGFEGNAFVAGQNLCLPVEMPDDWYGPVLTHELAHLFHHKLCGSDGGWERTLAAVIVEEGIATRTADLLFPNLPLTSRIGEPDWLAACEEHREALEADARPQLERTDDATLMQFVVNPDPISGEKRTAYALGWWLVGDWLAQGRTLSELARVPEKDLPAWVSGRLA